MTVARYSDLKDASVFLTGGGSGIGAAVVRGFAQQGAKVAFADLLDASAFSDEVERDTGHRPLALQADVTDTDALHAAMDKAAKAHGGLDVLVTLAARDTRMTAEQITPKDWDDMQALNLRHYFFACQKAASLMQGGGSIINFSSTSYIIGGANLAPYTAANAGIVGMTRTLAREWGPRDIRVNAVAPGWVMTERQKELWATPEALADFLDRQCLKRHMEPDDVVGTVLFLASSASAMMTSQTITVDAGVTVTG